MKPIVLILLLNFSATAFADDFMKGLTSDVLFPDELKINSIVANKNDKDDKSFSIDFRNLIGDLKTQKYDAKYYDQFTKTKTLAARFNGLLFVKSSGWGTTDRYDVNIAVFEWPANDLELEKVLPYMDDGKKIVLTTKSGHVQITPICYGCDKDHLNKVYKQLTDTLTSAGSKTVMINIGCGDETKIIQLPDETNSFDGKKLTLEPLVNDDGKCGWSLWSDLHTENGEDVGMHVIDICLEGQALSKALLAPYLSRTETIFTRVIKDAARQGRKVRIYPDIKSENTELFLGIGSE